MAKKSEQYQTKLSTCLFGIDAPETPKKGKRGEIKILGQPYGHEAMVYFRQLAKLCAACGCSVTRTRARVASAAELGSARRLRHSRSMQRRWVAMMVLITVVFGTREIAFALQCEGRIASIGDSPWEVKEACGEPTHIEEAIEVVLQLGYDEFRHTYVHIPVYVTKSIWTYNFGPTRLIYLLTFREQKLVKIETGGYGR